MKARLTAALGALILLFAVTPLLSSAASAAPSGAVQRQRQTGVTVALEAMKPAILGPKTKNLVVQAKVINRSGRSLAGLQAHLLYGDRFTTRSQLEHFAQSASEESTPHALHSSAPFDLAPGSSRLVKLTGDAARLASLHPSDLAVYPLAVTVTSAATGRLAGTHTYVNHVPKDARKNIKPTRVAFVWPIIDAPHRTTDQLFYDDALSQSIDADRSGRLSTLVSALGSGDKSVTLALDPGLLTDVAAMQAEYRVRGQEAPRPADEDAKAWLGKLRSYLKNPKNPFFLTPYGDVDTVALVNTRLANGQSSLLKAAYADKALGLKVLEKDAETYPDLAWPNSGTIDQATIDRLVANNVAANGRLGSGVFLLSSNQLMANGNHTPNAATTIETSKGRKKTAIAYDDTIQRIVSGDTRSRDAALGARQRYLAETAMITAELPNQSRTLVVVPDRRWNPGLDFARNLVARDERSAWLKPVSLAEVARPANRTADGRTFVTYPDEARQLSSRFLEKPKAMNKAAYAFSKIFPEPDTSLQRTAMRAASNYWRGRRQTAGYEFQKEAEKHQKAEINKVGLVSGPPKQLAGSSGLLKFTVANDFTHAPVKVLIRIASLPEGQLVFPDEDEKDQKVYVLESEIQPGQKDTIQVPVKLPTGSSFKNEVEVEVSVYNLDKQEVNSQTVPVRTTGISSIGLFITVGALGVLVVGVGFRGMRARRRRKEEEAQHDGAAV